MKQYQISNDTILYSEKENFLFKLSGRRVYISDIVLHETTQGLFLIIDNDDEQVVSNRTKIGVLFKRHDYLADINYKTKLKTAETDGKLFSNDLKLISVYHELCLNSLKHKIKEIDASDRFFIRSSEEYGENTIIYSKNGALFVPECQTVQSIEVPHQIEECYNDLQIRVILSNNTKVNAFLTSHNNIIRQKSTRINCSLDEYYEINGHYIIRKNKIITMVK